MASSTMITNVYDATFASTPNRVIQIAQAKKPSTNAMEQAIFDQINQYRASKGLPAFTRGSKIDNQARIHSQNMASAKVAFGHQNFSDALGNHL